jgi:hypothetical protein
LAAGGSLCECEFAYSVSAENSETAGEYVYSINNFLTYTQDVK